MKIEIEYYEFDCWKNCTPNGCMGHETDTPIGIWINNVPFYVQWYQEGNTPKKEELAEIEQAVKELLDMEADAKQYRAEKSK